MYKKTLMILNIVALIAVILSLILLTICIYNPTGGYTMCGLLHVFFNIPILVLSLIFFFLDSIIYYFIKKNIKELYPLITLFVLLVFPVYYTLLDLDIFWNLRYIYSLPFIIVYIIFSYFYRIKIYRNLKNSNN